MNTIKKITNIFIIVLFVFSLQSFKLVSPELTTNSNDVDNKIQQSEIKGLVTDKDGNPLPGVSIIIEGQSVGVQTNFDGEYAIAAKKGDQLTFSYIGMKSTTITVGDATTLNVEMEEDTQSLNEVIVVGYQSKEKANLTGSVSVVQSEALADRPTSNLASLLPGLTAGVSIANINPGRIGNSDSRIRIGALATRNAGDVLVIIDGISSSLDDVNPKDVETISFLKDAEAAIYGSRASEGVIIITTKKGGKPSIKASVSTTLSIPNIHPEKSTTIEYMNYLKEGWANNNTTPLWNFGQVLKYIDDNNLTSDQAIADGNFAHQVIGGFPDTPKMYLGGNSDWYDILYGTAVSKNYDVSVSGSSEKTNYYASLGVVDQESMLQWGNNSSKVYYSRLKYEYKHNKYVKVGVNVSLKTQNWVEPTDYIGAQNAAAGRLSFDHPFTQEGRYMGWNAGANVIGRFVDAGDRHRVQYDVQPQIYAVVTPIDNLEITGRFSKTLTSQRDRYLSKSFRTYAYDESPYGLNRQPFQTNVGVNNVFNQTFTGNLTATYKANLGEDHTIRALAGTSHEEFLYDTTSAHRNNLVYDGLFTLNLGDSEERFNSDAQSEVALKSYFGNLSYSFQDRYVLEGTYRRDGSTRFAQGLKWDSFVSFGGAWNITNEKFFQDLGLSNIDNLKLRGSWGELGNQASIGALGNNRYDYYSFLSKITIGNGSLLGVPGSVAPSQVATLGKFPNLSASWEVVEKTNIGLDGSFFNNRLNLDANYFISDTKNGFYTQDFPTILGATAPQINGARFKAKGWNVSIGWSDQINEDFSYNARFNIADANTEVIDLADTPVVKYGYNGFVEGHALGTIFGYAFDGLIADDADLADYYSRVTAGVTTILKPGDAKYKDLDGDGVLEGREYKEDANGNPTSDSGDLINLGDVEKHYEYNFNLGVKWKNFDLSAVLLGVMNQTVYDTTPSSYSFPWVQPYEHYIDNYWTPTKTDGHYPRANIINGSFNNSVQGNNYALSDAYYMKKNNAWLSIKNIQLGYTIPESITNKIRLEKVKFYVNASDVGFLVNNMPKSYSPEKPHDANVTPYPITVSFGLNVNF